MSSRPFRILTFRAPRLRRPSHQNQNPGKQKLSLHPLKIAKGGAASPKQIVDSSSARAVIAELRNNGYVEEQERGVIRFTIRGYKVHRDRNQHNWADSSVLVAV